MGGIGGAKGGILEEGIFIADIILAGGAVPWLETGSGVQWGEGAKEETGVRFTGSFTGGLDPEGSVSVKGNAFVQGAVFGGKVVIILIVPEKVIEGSFVYRNR